MKKRVVANVRRLRQAVRKINLDRKLARIYTKAETNLADKDKAKPDG